MALGIGSAQAYKLTWYALTRSQAIIRACRRLLAFI